MSCCNCNNNAINNRKFPIIYSCYGPTGPTGPAGGPTGATARCNKSSIYIFKW